MKRTSRIFLILFLCIHCFGELHPCTSIVVGKKASKDGSVLFGHNEDDSGTRVVNAWLVPRAVHAKGETIRLRNGGTIDQVPETWAMLWFQVNGLEFSDYYCNERGVAIASDACPSREDRPDLTDGGIGFPLRRIIAERAASAREGVILAGRLLDRFGYASSGRTLVICDPDEGWILSMVAGKHWIAQRVPDDGVAVLPNTYIVHEVNTADTLNFLTSTDVIVDYARKRGWWNPENGRAFDFAEAYRTRSSDSEALKKRGFDLRQWRGLSLLSGQNLSEEKAESDGLPFSIRPGRKVGVEDVMAVLRDHYENTKYKISPSGAANPHFEGERPICYSTTLFSIVAQLRAAMPLSLRACLWVAFGRPDTSPYVPWYLGMNRIPQGFHNTPGIVTADSALARHFDPVPGTFDPDPNAAFWIFKNLADRVNERYFDNVVSIATLWSAFENRIFRSREQAEIEARSLDRKHPDLAREFLMKQTHSLAQESVRLAREGIQRLPSNRSR